MNRVAVVNIIAVLDGIYNEARCGNEHEAIDALADAIDKLRESVAALDRFDPVEFMRQERDRQLCDWREG